MVAEGGRELADEPFPADLRDPRVGARATSRARAAHRRRLPAAAAPPAGRGRGAGEGGARPRGHIGITQLFLEGVYEEYVVAWLRTADAA
eukprot:6052030-Pleurochrysis_carterae.AAC.1